jgi:hypothetical protein
MTSASRVKRKRQLKLTREQRKLIHAPVESNAGAGWKVAEDKLPKDTHWHPVKDSYEGQS